jgi:hypothetical protein
MPDTFPLTLDAAHLAPDISPAQVAAWADRLSWASDTLTSGSGAGADFRGWLDPAAIVTDDQIAEIEAIAADLRAKSDTLVVVGIGGSYLGARAVIEALAEPGAPTVHFAGNSLSAHYHARLIETIKGQRVAVNVVSKSGTTTEPAVAFRLLRTLVEEQAGKDGAKDLIVSTTDEKKGALRKVAGEVGYRTLPIADDIGGRYSVLSPVGLLPIAYAGIDIRALLRGAKRLRRGGGRDRPPQKPDPVLRRRPEPALQSGLLDRGVRVVRAAPALPRRVVEAAFRRVRGQGPDGALPRRGRSDHRPPFDGAVPAAGPPPDDRDVRHSRQRRPIRAEPARPARRRCR